MSNEPMAPREFKRGILRLAEPSIALVNDEVVARHLAAAYIDADEEARADCSRMLREDLRQTNGER